MILGLKFTASSDAFPVVASSNKYLLLMLYSDVVDAPDSAYLSFFALSIHCFVMCFLDANNFLFQLIQIRFC